MPELKNISGFDGDLSTTEGKTRTFQAGVIRAFLETLEQDAISSKKIQARLMKEGASEEEAYLQVQELTDTLRSGKYSGEDGFIAKGQKLNIWDALAKGKQIQSLRAQWLAVDPDFLASIDPNLADVNSANAGVTVSMLGNAFSAFESFLKPKGATLKDAFQHTKAIDSKFDNPIGKDSENNYSTAKDLSKIFSNLYLGYSNKKELLIDINNKVVTTILPSGSSNQNYSILKKGTVLNYSGKVIGQVSVDGSVYSVDKKKIGKLLNTGQVIDLKGELIGELLDDDIVINNEDKVWPCLENITVEYAWKIIEKMIDNDYLNRKVKK